MTKKRFVKLLMAHGKSRNEAQAIAFYYNRCGVPYKKAYRKPNIVLGCAIFKVANAAKQLGKALQTVTCEAEKLAAEITTKNKFSTISTDFSTESENTLLQRF